MNPTGDPELDALKKAHLERELVRIMRNSDRREAREKTKTKTKGNVASPPQGSPNRSDADAGNSATDATPQKGGRGRNKDGTARKCANCGQVGHIKTNRKSVTFSCIFCNYHESKPRDSEMLAGSGAGRDSAGTDAAGAFSHSKFEL